MSFSETGKHGNHISIGKADQPDTQVHGRVKDTVKIKGISKKLGSLECHLAEILRAYLMGVGY